MENNDVTPEETHVTTEVQPITDSESQEETGETKSSPKSARDGEITPSPRKLIVKRNVKPASGGAERYKQTSAASTPSATPRTSESAPTSEQRSQRSPRATSKVESQKATTAPEPEQHPRRPSKGSAISTSTKRKSLRGSLDQNVEQQLAQAKESIRELKEEREELIKYVEELQQELAERDQSDPTGLHEEMRYLQGENQRLQRELKYMTRDLERTREALEREQDTTRKLKEEVRQARSYEEELDRLHQEIAEYKAQLEEQREKIAWREEEDRGLKEKQREQHKKLNSALDNLHTVAAENAQLKAELARVTEELVAVASEADSFKLEAERCRTIMAEAEARLQEALTQKASLETQLADTEAILQSRGTADQGLVRSVAEQIAQFKKAVESYKKQLAEKNAIIEQLKEQNAALADDPAYTELQKKVARTEATNSALRRELEQLRADYEVIAMELSKAEDQGRAALERANRFAERSREGELEEIKRQNETLKKQLEEEKARAKKAIDTAAELSDEHKRLEAQVNAMARGTFGLSEAVRECSMLRQQIKRRDEDIYRLTREMNQVENKLLDLVDENRLIRKQAGLPEDSKVDLEGLRVAEKREIDKLKALNKRYEADIRALEEERLKLKSELSYLIYRQGGTPVQGASWTGDLTYEELQQIDEFVKLLRQGLASAQDSKQLLELRRENEKLRAELDHRNKALSQSQMENEELIGAIRKVNADAATTSSAMDLETKIQIETLKAAGEAKEAELQRLREKLVQSETQLRLAQQREHEAEQERQRLAMVRLPPEIAQTLPPEAELAVANLYARMQRCQEDFEKKDQAHKAIAAELEGVKKQLEEALLRQNSLKSEHESAAAAWEAQKKGLQNQIRELEIRVEADAIKVQAFNEISALRVGASTKQGEEGSGNPIDPQQKAVDLMVKLTALRVSEAELKRRNAILLEDEAALRLEVDTFRRQSSEVMSVLKQRTIEAEAARSCALAHAERLEQEMQTSVPAKDYRELKARYDAICASYDELMQLERDWLERRSAEGTKLLEAQHALRKVEELQVQLAEEKAKAETLSRTIAELTKRSGKEGELATLSSRVAALEISESNARGRLERAIKKVDDLATALLEAEDRSAKLEEVVAALTGDKHKLQEELAGVRAGMHANMSKEDTESAQKRVVILEEQIEQLRIEITRHRELADVAVSQTASLKSAAQRDEVERNQLREALRDLMTKGDQSALLGRLHKQIIALETRAVDAETKAAQLQSVVSKLGAANARLEKVLEDKTARLSKLSLIVREQNRREISLASSTASTFGGSARAEDLLERLGRLTKQLREERQRSTQREEELRSRAEAAESRYDEVRIKAEEYGKLLEAANSPAGKLGDMLNTAKQLIEYKITEQKLQRTIRGLKERERFLLSIQRDLEENLARIEAAAIQKEDIQRRQVAQLEAQLAELQRQFIEAEQKERDAAERLERMSEAPDPTLPVAQQLSEALQRLEENTKIAAKWQQKAEKLAPRVEQLTVALREAEERILQQEVEINGLRLTVSSLSTPSDTAGGAARKRTEVADDSTRHASVEYLALEKLYKTAQETIDALQKRIEEKEETIAKFQEMLKTARERHLEEKKELTNEVEKLNQRLFAAEQSLIDKLRARLLSTDNNSATSPSDAPVSEPMVPLRELETVLAEKDKHITEILNRAEEMEHKRQLEVEAAQKEYHRALDELRRELEHAQSEAATVRKELEDAKSETETARRETAERIAEISRIEEEKQRLAVMLEEKSSDKGAVAQLRQRLSAKERELQLLQKAILELRAELANLASENKLLGIRLEESSTPLPTTTTPDTREREERIADREKKLKEDERRLKEAQSEFEQTQTKLHEELQQLRNQLAAKDEHIEKLNSEIRRYQKSIGTLQAKLRKADAEIAAMRERENANPRIAELEKRIKVLQMRGRDIPEKYSSTPSSTPVAAPPPVIPATTTTTPQPAESRTSSASEEVSVPKEQPRPPTNFERWETEKKLNKKIDMLKTRLSQRDKELEECRRELEKLKARALGRGGATNEQAETSAAALVEKEKEWAKERVAFAEQINALRTQLFQTEEESRNLRKQLEVEKEAELRKLRRRLEQAEGTPRSTSAPNEPKRRIEELEDQVLDLSNEILELKFDRETSDIEVGRWRRRVEELEKYIAVLKSAQLAPSSAASKSGPNRPKSAKRNEVAELQEVIEAMKVVVNKLKTENATLRKSAASNVKYMEAVKEVKALRKEREEHIRELTDLRQRCEAAAEAVSKAAKLEKELSQLKAATKRDREEVQRITDEAAEWKRRCVDLEAKVAHASQQLKEIQNTDESEAARVQKENELLRKQVEEQHAMIEDKTALLEEIKSRMAEKLESTEKELARLEKENRKLRAELSAFDPEFFEEIRDLKFNYQEAVKQLKMYEERLAALASQYGIPANKLPSAAQAGRH